MSELTEGFHKRPIMQFEPRPIKLDCGCDGRPLFSVENMMLLLNLMGIRLKWNGSEALKEDGSRFMPQDIKSIEVGLVGLGIPKSGSIAAYLLVIAEHGGLPKGSTGHVLTDEDIASAYRRTKLSTGMFHEHPDCVRIAYEWFSAQKTVKYARDGFAPLKHIIEGWGMRYVSTSDVEVAATLHPNIWGKYPSFNLAKTFTCPKRTRLDSIDEAEAHKARYTNTFKYSRWEPYEEKENDNG